ncbi:hypothetical protein A5893_03040 [Pedobacter psychrophilus]|uniref:Uncharacterized protein n=1 Tax=Pedobacter psychrophilus TaxID=1826909 RepID=A0A179DM31_9SPHI|nr:hypothetical protein [Pedobacter psychrophilus]OAQ42105.1 hypothetical protein A5893_03040 [Pedobacter psychrophilus]
MKGKYTLLNNGSVIKILNPERRHVILDLEFTNFDLETDKSLFNHEIAKQHLGYLLIREDMKVVLSSAKELKTNNLLSDLLKEALSSHISILYGKCFSEAKKRRVVLEHDIVNKFDNELKTLHNKLIEIRNTQIAHAGSEIYSKSHLMFSFDESSKSSLYLSSLEFQSFNYNLELLEKLVIKLIETIELKIEESFKALKREMSKDNIKNEIFNNSFYIDKKFLKDFDQIKNSRIILNRNNKI